MLTRSKTIRFSGVCSTSLLKTPWQKEKRRVTRNFSLSPGVYYRFGELYAIFTKYKNCCLRILSVWKSLRFVVWERVKEVKEGDGERDVKG